MLCAAQDPGNLESDLQAGARTGYTLAWVLMWSTVMVSIASASLMSSAGLDCFSPLAASMPAHPFRDPSFGL